jgi:hypothetical protein
LIFIVKIDFTNHADDQKDNNKKKIEQMKKYDDEEKKILDDFRMKIVKHTFY